MKKLLNIRSLLLLFVLLSFVAGAVYTLIGMMTAPAEAGADIAQRTSGDYQLLFAQSIVGLIAIVFPF